MLLGYDPVRVIVLRTRVDAAIERLGAVRSDDPAAADAVTTAAATRLDLEQWRGLIDRIVASDAMLAWLSATSGLTGPLLRSAQAAQARDLADLARAVLAADDTAGWTALRQGLDGAAATPVVLVAVFADLGGEATADLMVHFGEGSGADDDEQLAVAGAVRSALAAASRQPAFPADFAPTLVDGFVARIDDGRANPGAAMTFLFTGPPLGTDFLVAAAKRMVEHEQEALDEELGPLLWPAWPPGSVLNRAFTDEGDGTAAPGWVLSEDPAYALLGALAADGEAGRRVFTDDELAAYLLGARRYDLDGLRAVSAAAATAAAGPDVVAGADTALLTDAAEVASAFVNHVGGREHLFDLPLHPGASASAATILGTHLFAVHNAVLRPDRLGAPTGATIPLLDEHRPGQQAVGALFDDDALDVASELAVRSADGLATMRAALDLYQRDEAAAVAALLDDADEPAARLEDAMVDAARLEAHFIQRAGHQAEAIGRSKDQVISFWIDTASFSIGKGNGQLKGRLGSAGVVVPIIGDALGPAADIAKSLLADHEATAARNATANAEAAADQLLYVWYRELHAAGVVTPALPAAALEDGVLVTWEEFQGLSDRDRAVVRNAMEETAGVANLDAGTIRDAIKVEQLPIYDDLD